MAAEKISYEFGMADFIFDEGLPTELRFDGKMCEDGSLLQAEGGEVQLEPELTDINMADFGDTNYDQVVVGWNGTVTVVAAKSSLDVISKTLSGTITFDRNGKAVSVTDAPIGASLRAGARTLTIHPRQMGEDKSEDIFIHKIANSSGMTKSFANEQGNYEIEFAMFPKDCADANKPNNYFYIGEDPDKLEETEDPVEEPSTP
ncbi:hypothetical protein [Mammaliicoccus sciuri]|uniref:hypothetical protein n=1 Tax=Mammaliicoccus sciuri TaxID=1296 RepID=UPI0036D98165